MIAILAILSRNAIAHIVIPNKKQTISVRQEGLQKLTELRLYDYSYIETESQK
ncbi:MAG: hypothetical protein QNJ55_31950 [Xenococcus sp. MO_188.B8]|nr:hypothetical protein [Xenococcus sp. MO_188.B8]